MVVPSHKPLRAHNWPLLHSSICEHRVVTEYTLGWHHEAFACRILEKHRWGFVLVISQLYYFSWLRDTAREQEGTTPGIDLSLWINVLAPKQGNLGQRRRAGNAPQLRSRGGNAPAAMVFRSKPLARLTKFLQLLRQNIWTSAIKHTGWRATLTGSNLALSGRYSSGWDERNDVASVGTALSNDVASVGTALSNGSHFPERTTHAAPYLVSKRYPGRDVLIPGHRIVIRDPVVAKNGVERAVKAEVHAGNAAAHRMANWRESIAPLPFLQRKTYEHDRFTTASDSKANALVTWITSRSDTLVHKKPALHSVSASNPDDQVRSEPATKRRFIDSSKASKYPLSGSPRIQPRLSKQTMIARFARQTVDQQGVSRSKPIRTTGQMRVEPPKPEYLAVTPGTALRSPHIKYASTQGMPQSIPQRSQESDRERGPMVTADIAPAAPGTSAAPVNTRVLADRVYGLIVDRVKTELRMRGR